MAYRSRRSMKRRRPMKRRRTRGAGSLRKRIGFRM